MELKIKLTLSGNRKRKHLRTLELAIAGTHCDIVKHVLKNESDLAELKAKLFLKYSRRFKYLTA
jgi:hypothetical protein|tara:strand:+ start:754 stop:945 length:192 start_codon:yes stop_codon:yes gene_type:complete